MKENELHITIHNKGKLLGIPSLNTSPMNNAFCKMMSMDKENVCSRCYARRLLGFRTNAEQLFEKNGELLSEPLKTLPEINAIYFRLHSFGELINETHYMNFLRIARANPRTKFALWTKRVDLVKTVSRPINLILNYSVPKLDPPDSEIKLPDGFDNVYAVYSKGCESCGESCFDCLKCWQRNGRNVIKQLVH